MLAIDFHGIFFLPWKSMATVNFLISNIFLNILFCVQQKKETHTELEHDEKMMIEFSLKGS